MGFGVESCLSSQASSQGRPVPPLRLGLVGRFVSPWPTLQPLTPEGALPVGVKHDVHEECGNGGQRVGVQAGDTEPVAWAGQWVDDGPLDRLGLHEAVCNAKVLSCQRLAIDDVQGG